nr:hypothetical protein [Tanacetum cinerariifolium]
MYTQGDDPISCLNKAMDFLSVVVASRFPSTNNQLRTSSNLRNHVTIQEDKVIVQQVQGRPGQSYVGTGYKGNTTSSGGNNTGGQTRTEDIDAYDSNCDDFSNAKAVLMANISIYGLDVISKVPHSESYHNDLENQSVHPMQDFKQTPVVDLLDNEIIIENYPLIWPTVEENEVTRAKKYAELSAAEKIQADCDMKATNIILQGRDGQSYSGTGYKSNATSSGGNNASEHARVVKFYNCQGEGHMARQCTQPKRPRNAAWYKDKAMLVEAREARNVLDEEQLAFFADPGVPDGQAVQTIILNNAAFQTKNLDTYDFDYDDVLNAKAVLMANISIYASNVILETTKEKVDTSKSLDASLVETKCSGTELGERDTSSRSRNDAHADDVDIRPIYDEEPMAE